MTDADLRNSVYLLMAKLCAARELYEENQREGVQAAVASLSTFVTNISYHGGIPHLPSARLDDLLGHLGLALAGLDQGSVDPLLAHDEERRRQILDAEQDKKRGLKVGLSLQEQMQRAVVAASLHGLYRAGHTLEVAAGIVVKELKGNTLLAGIKGRKTRTVRRWRTEIMNAAEKRRLSQTPHDTPPERMAARVYNEMVASIDARLAAGTPKELVAVFAVSWLKFGYGMPDSDFLPTKSERGSA